MDNNKKLFEGLLKADGIDPANITESERMVFRQMLDREKKRMKHISWLTIGALWLFVLATITLCLSENFLERLHIPFAVPVIALATVVVIAMNRYMPRHNRKLEESNKNISKLHYLVYGRHRGIAMVSRKNGKRIIHWFRLFIFTFILWLGMSSAGAGVYYLMCQRWIYSSPHSFAMWLHIFLSTVMPLSFLVGILRDGLKAPLDELVEVKAKSKKSKPGSRLDIWSIIMKSKITKFTVAGVVSIAALIGINQFYSSTSFTNVAWADVVDKFRSVSFYNAVLYFKEDIASEPKQIELWVSSEHKARLRIGSQILFAKNGEIAAGFDFKDKEILSENEYDKMGAAIIQNLSEHQTLSLDKFVRLFYESELVEITPEINSDVTISQDLLVFDLHSTINPEWMRIWALRESKLPIRLRIWDPRDGECTDAFVTYEKQQPAEFFDHHKYEELLFDTSRTAGPSVVNLAYALLKDPGDRDYAPQYPSGGSQDNYPVKGHLSIDELIEHYQANPLEPGQVEFRAGLRKDGLSFRPSINGLQDYNLLQVGTTVPHFAKSLNHNASAGRFRFEGDFDDIFVQYDIISRGNVSTQKQKELALSKVGVEIVESEDDCTVWIAEYNGQEFKPAHKIKCPIHEGRGPGALSDAYPIKIDNLLRHLAKEQDIVVEDETGIDKETHLSNVMPNLREKEGAELAEKWYRDNFGITFRKETRRMPVWIVRKKS